MLVNSKKQGKRPSLENVFKLQAFLDTCFIKTQNLKPEKEEVKYGKPQN